MKFLESSHILARIVEATRQRLQRSRMRVPDAIVRHLAAKAAPAPSLRDALENTSRVRIIAEIKKASPSKGLLSRNFSVTGLAESYTAAGAAAISVVTENEFFQGDLGWISEIRKISPLPVLRKDFVFDPYQIYESRASGASAVLLIAAMLRPEELASLLAITRETGLQALVEVHDETELREAIGAGADIVGVNNRDLKTFHVNLEVSHRLAPLIPDDRIFVVESGIRTASDIEGLVRAGADAFLIGETLVASGDPETTLRGLL